MRACLWGQIGLGAAPDLQASLAGAVSNEIKHYEKEGLKHG